MPAKPSGPIKVMDITHPSNIQPDATSRPVLVPSRPMVVADPMIAQSAVDVLTKGGAEKSAGDPTEMTARTPELIIDRQAKTVTPDEAIEPKDTNADVPAPELTEQELAGVPPVDAEAVKKVPSPIIEITKPAETTPVADVMPANDAQKDTPNTEAVKPLAPSQSTFEISESDEDESDDDTALEKTAEQKQAENIEKLVASRLYAVPIGKRAKRRARMLLVTLFVVLLALLTVDLMLDMGFLKISGIPHTTFFSL